MAQTPPAEHEQDGGASGAAEDVSAPFASLADTHRRGRVRPAAPGGVAPVSAPRPPTRAPRPALTTTTTTATAKAAATVASLKTKVAEAARRKPTVARTRRPTAGRILVRIFDRTPSAKPVVARLSPDTGTTGGIAWAVRSLVLIAGVGITIVLAGTWNGGGPTIPEAQPIEEMAPPPLAPAGDPTDMITPTTPPPTEKTTPPKESDEESGGSDGGGGSDDDGGDSTKRPTPAPEPDDDECPVEVCYVPDDPEPTEEYTPYDPDPEPTETDPGDDWGQFCSVDPTTGQVWCY